MPPKKVSKKPVSKPSTGSQKGKKDSAPKNNKKPGELTKDQKDKEKEKSRQFVPVPESANNEDVEFSEDDVEFFTENQDFKSFLHSMDPKELTRNTKKAKKSPAKKTATRAPVPEPTELSSSEDELDYDFEAADGLDSDVEGLSGADDSEEDEVIGDSDELADLDDLEMDEEEMMLYDTREPSQKKAQKLDDESDEEMDYETKPRKIANEWTRKDYHTKLPIKLPGGKIKQVEEKHDSDVEEEEVVEEVVEEEDVEEAEEKEDSDNEVALTKKQYIMKKKEELAQMASEIQEDPEASAGQLRFLREAFKDENTTVKKLVILTQLAVYKDIIPGYRIRPLSDKEEGIQVSKEVKKLRDYERQLLHNYEEYLKDLESLITKRKIDEDYETAMIATRCLCELLTTKTHFNFRLNIMVAIVTRMSTLKWNEIAEMCNQAIITVFINDESGRTSLDAVKMMTRMIKSKGYAVHEKVINSFLYLRLKDEMAPVANQADEQDKNKKRKREDKPFLTKKARKARKETREIEKEFQEAEAVVSKEEKDKNHTETLKLIFAFYFRILKKQTTSPLLPAVLEGLARFAHLINVDFFDDLLNAIKDVMHSMEVNVDTKAGSLSRKRLLCIITAFQLLSGQGEALNYDLKEFYNEMYVFLLKAGFHTNLEDKPDTMHDAESELMIKSLELMFLKKRQIPINRMAAFAKRLAMSALYMPNKIVLQCLGIIHRLLQKDRRLDALVQSEDRAASGVYLPLLGDPELCNPFGTSLYELFLYQNHYDPSVRALAQTLQEPQTI
ncbi:nucleolar complex-associated protein-domain-containing protein [Phycomyces blakesleeanus]|uniref:Nucleolar complex-associated protein 3 n=1 Tax=Phycomyces blakesleeanus TaxID=4837 RepID=A0ABR3BF37_PHYBL